MQQLGATLGVTRCRGFIRTSLCWLMILAGAAGLFWANTIRERMDDRRKDNGLAILQHVSSSNANSVSRGHRTKNIEDIKAGERVWAVDPVTGQWSPKTVLKPLVHQYKGILVTVKVAGDTVEATGNHPFWVVAGENLRLRPVVMELTSEPAGDGSAGRWVYARDLQAGDRLLLQNGRRPFVDLVLVRKDERPVYNLEVADLHTYAVGYAGIAVHNCPVSNCFPPGTLVFMGDGSRKPIEQITLDDWVMSCDPKSGKLPAPERVEGLWRDFTDGLVQINFFSSRGEQGCIKATGFHPFWTEGREWVFAKDLKVGDVLRDDKQGRLDVTKVSAVHHFSRSHNLSIEKTHTFYIVTDTGLAVLTHNAPILFDPNQVAGVAQGLFANGGAAFGVYNPATGAADLYLQSQLVRPFSGVYHDAALDRLGGNINPNDYRGFVAGVRPPGSPEAGQIKLGNSSSLNAIHTGSSEMEPHHFDRLRDALEPELNKFKPFSPTPIP